MKHKKAAIKATMTVVGILLTIGGIVIFPLLFLVLFVLAVLMILWLLFYNSYKHEQQE